MFKGTLCKISIIYGEVNGTTVSQKIVLYMRFDGRNKPFPEIFFPAFDIAPQGIVQFPHSVLYCTVFNLIAHFQRLVCRFRKGVNS